MKSITALLWGLLAFFIAKEAGVTVWRDWIMGDAADIGLVTALATWRTMEWAEKLALSHFDKLQPTPNKDNPHG